MTEDMAIQLLLRSTFSILQAAKALHLDTVKLDALSTALVDAISDSVDYVLNTPQEVG